MEVLTSVAFIENQGPIPKSFYRCANRENNSMPAVNSHLKEGKNVGIIVFVIFAISTNLFRLSFKNHF